MTLHIIKLVVGVEDFSHFVEVQNTNTVEYYGRLAVPVHTRFKPKREKEILKGGSLYRVVKNRIQCRQEILGFESLEHKEKGKICQIMVSAEIMRTLSMPHRPFQGWRYFQEAAAPRDTGLYDPANDHDNIPKDLELALKESGLL